MLEIGILIFGIILLILGKVSLTKFEKTPSEKPRGLQRLVIINHLFAKFTQTNHAQTRCVSLDQTN